MVTLLFFSVIMCHMNESHLVFKLLLCEMWFLCMCPFAQIWYYTDCSTQAWVCFVTLRTWNVNESLLAIGVALDTSGSLHHAQTASKYWCHWTELSFLYLSIHVRHILIIDSRMNVLFLIIRTLYMLFIFKVIAVYFKTICNSIFHKPTLSIPVSLPHSFSFPFLSLSFSHMLPSSSQSQNTLQHM